jgi:hypothetical protein
MTILRAKLADKLKNTAGESLSEVLIALLIAALAMTMLASAISSTSKILTKSKTSLESYYAENDKVAEQKAVSGTGGTKTTKVKLTLVASESATSANYTVGEVFLAGTGENQAQVDVYYIENKKAGSDNKKTVVSYWKKRG